jgi:hypothetical protein
MKTDDSKDLFDLGAEPIDITAARLLWKSPWWAKTLESTQDAPFTEMMFLRALGTLLRDCRKSQKHKVGGMQEFADLATMARKVRWKNVPGPGFGGRRLAYIKNKLSYLQWNPSIARFEFKLPERLGPELKDWRTLSKSAKRRQAFKVRKWRKEHKLERVAANLERENKVSNLLAEVAS